MARNFTKKEKAHLWCRLTKKYVFIALVPLIFCPIPVIVNTQVGYMAFIIFLMGTYWVTEVIPLPATALIPMVLFPIFGIRDTGTVVQSYFQSAIFLVFGGLVLAAAIEHQNLHRRFALRVLLMFGTDPKRLLLGFMSATAFLSSWMSNTAVTAMMLPIARAVLDEIGKQDIKEEYDIKGDFGGKTEEQHANKDVLLSEEQRENRNDGELPSDEHAMIASPSTTKHSRGHLLLCKAVILCIPYAANVGGTGSLVGTPPNVVCLAVTESLFGRETGLNFGSWTLYCFPQMVICILVIWVWLQFMYLPHRCKSQSQDGTFKSDEIKRVIQRAYDDLGPTRFAEWAVLGHFLVIVVLWITQDPQVFPGWGSFFNPGLKSATPTILITISLFMFPSERPLSLIKIKEQQMNDMSDLELGISNGANTSATSIGNESHPKQAKVKSIPALINWDVVHEKMPWGVLLVVGGGFALADGCVESGLSAWMAEQFEIFYGVPPFAMALITALMISVLTEFTANTVTTTIFLPIVAEMAVAMRINPLYLMITTAVTASFAFMLPVATPPNAIAFSNREIKVIDMVKTGALLNLMCIFILLFFMNTLGRLIFNIAVFPDWANNHDVTGSPNTTNIIQLM